MNLRTLSLSEFLRHAYTQTDALTSSDIERELLRRLEAIDTLALEAIDHFELTGAHLREIGEALEGFAVDEVVELLGVMLESDIEVKPLIATLKVLDKAGITEPDELKEALEFAAKFQAIANDAGDVFTRLNTLISETQED